MTENEQLLNRIQDLMSSLGNTSDEVAAKLAELDCKGEFRDSSSCPIATYLCKNIEDKSIKIYVDSYDVAVYGERFIGKSRVPPPCSQFVRDFDSGCYHANLRKTC